MVRGPIVTQPVEYASLHSLQYTTYIYQHRAHLISFLLLIYRYVYVYELYINKDVISPTVAHNVYKTSRVHLIRNPTLGSIFGFDTVFSRPPLLSPFTAAFLHFPDIIILVVKTILRVSRIEHAWLRYVADREIKTRAHHLLTLLHWLSYRTWYPNDYCCTVRCHFYLIISLFLYFSFPRKLEDSWGFKHLWKTRFVLVAIDHYV